MVDTGPHLSVISGPLGGQGWRVDTGPHLSVVSGPLGGGVGATSPSMAGVALGARLELEVPEGEGQRYTHSSPSSTQNPKLGVDTTCGVDTQDRYLP